MPAPSNSAPTADPLRAFFLWKNCGEAVSTVDQSPELILEFIRMPTPRRWYLARCRPWRRTRMPVSLQKGPVKTRGALWLHPSSAGHEHICNPSTDRRRLLYQGLAAGCGLLLPARLAAAQNAARSLKFYNIHTRESLRATYWESGHYLQDSLRQIDFVLRDFRTGEVHPIDP